MSHSSHTYRGVNTSLYRELSQEAIQWIEQTIWLRTTGCMAAARLIFDKELLSMANTPIVIIERASLENEAGRWGQAWRILDTALNDLERAKADLDLPEHRLMTLMWVMFGVRHRGDLVSATRELERTKSWLRNVRVTEYTDVQTSCIRYYTIAYLLTRLSSSFQDDAMERIPMIASNPTEPGEAWSGLHDLRRSLVDRDMFNEANALFRVELNRTPITDRDPVIREFLDQIASMPSYIGRTHMESAVRLQWSTSYIEAGNAARAVEELAAAEASFNMWCEEFHITDTQLVPQFAALICAKLVLIGDESLKLQVAEDLLGMIDTTESSKTGILLSTASESASALFQATGNSKYLDKYFALHERLEKYDAEVSEDLCDLIIHRNYLITFTSTNLVDRQKSLEWIDGFFERYPYFVPPAEMESLHRRRSILLSGLRRLEESKKAEEIADGLVGQGPSLGRWIHMGFGKAIGSQPNPSMSSSYEDEDEEGEVFFQTWAAIVGDQKKVVDTAVDLVYRWAAEDRKSGHLAPQTYREIMGITSDECVQQLPDKIDKAERETLLAALVPTDVATAESCKEKWRLVVDWLSNPPKGQRLKRLFCLLMLRGSRQYSFSDNHLWDLRIQELELILEFHSRLPPIIQELTRAQPNSWLAALAETYMAQLLGNPNLSDPNIYALLLKAEKYCNMANVELRKNYQPGPALVQQRVGAQIYLLKIVRLEQQLESMLNSTSPMLQGGKPDTDCTNNGSSLRDDIEQEIMALRKLGLEKVRESERISTASELEASWLDGLDGVRERQHVLEYQISYWTVHNAIQLLLKGPEPTEETTTAVWNWVQKYKARSLARTIGTRSDIPPGLLSQILASADARTVYNEMLDLQERIDRAPLKARFDLRRQLDNTRRQMKEDPILRRLIDLREGSPLDLADIEEIEHHAGRPVVLVDWFYLPPYPDNAVGRILLLTVRAGSSPTIDVLTTSMEDIHAWQNEYLNPQKLCLPETRHHFNKKLAGLVAPLLRRSDPDDVLVLCPSATLHRLPLHALNFTISTPGTDDEYSQPLIHRNPVVYIHSLSLLRSSLSAAEHARYSPQKTNPQFLAGISEADATVVVNGRQSVYTAGRNSVKMLADKCETLPRIDESASKHDFMTAMTQSRLLHLHTHCNWQFSDPLDHHVEFPNVHGAAREDENPDLKLTAKEIFGIRLRAGTHVNMIACQGGLMEVKMGDEVMGLVPALLFSGATSTISTLWSIADQDGARFSKLFFESFFEQCKEHSEADSASLDGVTDAETEGSRTKLTRFVDIAAAVQEAVFEIDSDGHASLYSWAGFVLHGYWMFSLSLEDVGRFARASSD